MWNILVHWAVHSHPPPPTQAWPPPCQRRPYDRSPTQPGHLARPAPAGQSISERLKPASITKVPVENRWSHQVPSFGNPAGGTKSKQPSGLSCQFVVRALVRLEPWVTRVEGDARIGTPSKIAS